MSCDVWYKSRKLTNSRGLGFKSQYKCEWKEYQYIDLEKRNGINGKDTTFA